MDATESLAALLRALAAKLRSIFGSGITQQIGNLFFLHVVHVLGAQVYRAIRYLWRLAFKPFLISLEERLKMATSYADYAVLAKRLDDAKGAEAWKAEKESHLYSASELQDKIDRLAELRRREDVHNLMWMLRASLNRRNLAVCSHELWDRCHWGTKHLVEQYVETMKKAIAWVVTTEQSKYSHQEKLAFLLEVKQAFGRTGLFLSGGAARGFYHLGVVKALAEQRLVPRVISGASAGSIVAGVLAVRTDEEYLSFLSDMDSGKYGEAFFQPFKPLRDPKRFLGFNFGSSLLNPDALMEFVRNFVGEYTFLEAYDRTGRVLNINVSAATTNRPLLLNYLTAPHVLISSAICSSCAIPKVFGPQTLVQRTPEGDTEPFLGGGSRWSDGSLADDLPKQRMAELFNVNQTVVSQVNIHAHMFSTERAKGSVRGATSLGQFCWALILFLTSEIRSFTTHAATFLFKYEMVAKLLGRLRVGVLVNMLAQEYEGDVTIYQPGSLFDLFTLISNPTKESIKEMISVGERSTWPHLEEIRQRTSVEYLLTKLAHGLMHGDDDDRQKMLKHTHSFMHNAQESIRRPSMSAILKGGAGDDRKTSADSNELSPTGSEGSRRGFAANPSGRKLLGGSKSFSSRSLFLLGEAIPAPTDADSVRATSVPDL
jgi:TAG lipase/steryl ester hydrolase/phospholipase A2/LPA acyltransferase